MSEISSAYDEMLEDTECPVCGHIGMVSDGSYEYECPNCGTRGSL